MKGNRIVLGAFAALGAPVNAQQVWSGLDIEFVKPGGADWTLPEYQDQITFLVHLTRGDAKGLFNIVQESGYSDFSPADTEWSYGKAEDWADLEFQPWVQWHGMSRHIAVGKDAVVHLITDDIYIDIMMTEWGNAFAGASFAYLRAACPADCNLDDVVDVFDFLCFQGLATQGDAAADCNADGLINVFDFLCFQGAVTAGCP